MSVEVIVAEHYTFDRAVRAFGKAVEKAGIMGELKRRRHFTPPSQRRKAKAAVKRKRSRAQKGSW